MEKKRKNKICIFCKSVVFCKFRRKMGKRKRDYDRLVVDYDSDDPYAAFGKKRKISKKIKSQAQRLIFCRFQVIVKF